MKQTKKESRQRKGKHSHPSDAQDECNALFREFSGAPLLGLDKGTGDLLNSSGLGWFPSKARCHSPY